ncbi:MAG: queuosine precursor transporter [Deltaproteobacteria bacterium]|nr:queuosine precursor transporter [Deltaproteobacteria bacterium]
MKTPDINFLKYLFITALLIANIMASKIISVGGMILPAAIVLYPLTFLITDVVSEIEGKRSAHRLVMTGFYLSLFMVLFLLIGKILPPAPFWKNQEAYMAILGSTPRIVAASMIAYLVSQNHDIWAFHWWREKTGGRHLWIRNNLSTIVSQFVDSVLFISLAFAGTYAVKTVLFMIIGQYAVKVVIALLDTPFCYLLVWLYGNDRKRIPGT